MKEIQLSQQGIKNRGKYIALVDDEDFERVNQFRWFAHKIRHGIYAQRHIYISGIDSIQHLHNFIMGVETLSGIIVDHIFHNGLDCQKANMRICLDSQNRMNRTSHKKTHSQYKGVSWHNKNKKWVSNITCYKNRIYLGSFINEIDAAKAYDQKAIELFGEFACLNNTKQIKLF